MINFAHYQNSKDVLENNTIYDDGDTFKISYEFNGKSFTINMKYFWDDGRFYGFVNFGEHTNNIDKDSSYLVGYIIERYINQLSNSDFPTVTIIFYTADNTPEYHKSATAGFDHVSFFNSNTDIQSTKYKFYIVSCHNHITPSWTTEQLIHFMDTQL